MLSPLVATLVIMSFPAYGQETVPDGTEGERLEVVKPDTLLHEKWRDKRWRLFKGRYSSLKVGLGFLYDFVGHAPDQTSRQQQDSAGNTLQPTFDVRDFRLILSGKLTTRRNITWKAGLMYNGDTREWLFRETGVMVAVPELSGSVFVGRTKEGFSLNKVLNGYAGWTVERQMALDVIPILADGVKWMGFLPKEKIFWNAGIFTDWVSKNQSFSTYRWQTAARVGWLPIYAHEEKQILHIGVSYRYGEPRNGEIKVRSRPESNSTPFFLDAGNFKSNYSNHFGAEVYYTSGPWLLGTEIYSHRFHSPEANNPVFDGGEFFASYLITGESRPYYAATAVYGFVPVDRPVFKGGPGAWDVVLRFSTFELNGGNLAGGKFWRITPMVNWYLSKELRLELAYGYGVLDRFNLKGATHFFQARIQVSLL